MRRTMVVLVAVAAIAGVVATDAGAAENEIGVLGCSNTAIATIGYHQVSAEHRLWYASADDNPFADYWGQDIVKWAEDTGPGAIPWAAFDAELAANPATSAVWFQVCVRADDPGSTDTVDAIVALIRQRLPEAIIYASPLDDTPSCTIGDPALSEAYVDHLVETGKALRGPTLSPLADDQVKGCHAFGDGIPLHGTDLADFFDGDGPPPPAPATGFDDVPPEHPFVDDILWLADSGITLGCNPPNNDRFCPADVVTRGQMAAFLVRALGLEPSSVDAFTDDDGVFEADIRALAAAGITTGCTPDRFCPGDPVTRAQMATFLVNGFGWTEGAGDDLFSDDDASVHRSDIDVLATAGVTLGCNPPVNDRFCPADPVTRAQMAAFLHRAIG